MKDVESPTFNLWYESHLPDLPSTRWDFFLALRCAFLAGVAVGECNQDDIDEGE